VGKRVRLRLIANLQQQDFNRNAFLANAPTRFVQPIQNLAPFVPAKRQRVNVGKSAGTGVMDFIRSVPMASVLVHGSRLLPCVEDDPTQPIACRHHQKMAIHWEPVNQLQLKLGRTIII
jgi:UDP-glucose 4-epimerase